MLVVRRSEKAPITRIRNLLAARERNGAGRLVRVTPMGVVDPGRVQHQPTNSPCLRGTVPVQHCVQRTAGRSASQAS